MKLLNLLRNVSGHGSRRNAVNNTIATRRVATCPNMWNRFVYVNVVGAAIVASLGGDNERARAKFPMHKDYLVSVQLEESHSVDINEATA